MDLGLKGLSALITGASKGIGAEIAKSLAKEGCNLHLAARNIALLDDLASGLRASCRVSVSTHAHDLSIADEIEALANNCNGVDILINNAGAIARGSLSDVLDDEWRRVWDLKVFGYISLTRLIYNQMKERRSGTIVNIVGMAAERPDYYYIAGVSGNAALNMFTLSLGGEAPRFGVRAVAVNPGPIDSEKYRKGLAKRAQQQFGDATCTDRVLAEMPIGRPGRAKEVADAVAFLASPRASYISGASIRIDGGLFARPPSA